MHAIELRAYDGVSLVFVSNKQVPAPAPGEVLVRVHSAPITAADVALLQGRGGVRRPLPAVPGLTCSGVVVQSGGGLIGRALVGRRVCCLVGEQGDGTWAEYVCVPAAQALEMPEAMTLTTCSLSMRAQRSASRMKRSRLRS